MQSPSPLIKPEALRNRIFCNRSEVILDRCPQLTFDFICADPPYGYEFRSNMREKSEKFKMIEGDDTDDRFKMYPRLFNVLKHNSVLAVFCSWKNEDEDRYVLKEVFGKENIRNLIIWFKGGGGIGDLDSSLADDYEMIIICHKGRREINSKRYGTVWQIPKVPPAQMVHSNEKPISLYNRLFRVYTKPGDHILDPYLGSGSSSVAAVRLKRPFTGIEFDREYALSAHKRFLTAIESGREDAGADFDKASIKNEIQEDLF
jgi:DNA modification methylase